MDPMTTAVIETPFGQKTIDVVCADIRELDEPLDVMTVSAFLHNYEPVPRTLIGALSECGVDVKALSEAPSIDLRKTNRVWLSAPVPVGSLPIRRIGCAELTKLSALYGSWDEKDPLFDAIRSYFRLLELAGFSGIPVEAVGMPLLGAGSQGIPAELVLVPLLNECLRLLKQCEQVRRIVLFARSPKSAYQIAKKVDESAAILRQKPQSAAQIPFSGASAFISYAGEDKNIADNLCAKLESRGIRVWYAPRNASGAYAEEITNAISSSTHFVCILSRHSLNSQHVLSEVNLAFNELNRSILFRLLKIDEEELGPAFRYYLSRQHWMDAQCPPLEARLEEFADGIAAEWQQEK